MTLVTFTKAHGPYVAGDSLFVDDDQLAELQAAGVIQTAETREES